MITKLVLTPFPLFLFILNDVQYTMRQKEQTFLQKYTSFFQFQKLLPMIIHNSWNVIHHHVMILGMASHE